MADAVRVYCPRCDRVYLGKTRLAGLETMSKHVDEAHPDMVNYIRDELEDEKREREDSSP